jgi:3-methylfumaryl-CoA hydratase
MSQLSEPTDYGAWVGRTERADDPMSVVQARAAHATLDEPGPPPVDGDALPLPWHWFHFLPCAAQSALDVDGHPRRGGFLPPIPYPRRMFAGARITLHRPLRVGTPAARESTIRSVVMKAGHSGPLAFVTVGQRIVQRGELCVEEEQDIVYRASGGPVAAPLAAELPPPPAGAWVRTLQPDTRLLFRFSALTFNAHRIHYDRGYASEVEGYPGLVVHGPLTATLLLQLVRHATSRPLRAFSFRGLAPLFDLGPVRLLGTLDGDQVALQAQGPDGVVALSASATLG